MKKVLFLGLMFGALALTSCKKDYTCTIEFSQQDDEVVEYNDLNNSDADDAKSSCEAAGGDWSEQ